MSQGDQYLVDQIQAGDTDAWSQLVARYQGRLRAFARKQLGNDADADDIVQETFINFLSSADRFDHRASLETYLFMILRRRAVDVLRKRGRGGVTVCQLQDSLRTDEQGDSSGRGEERAVSAEPNPSDMAQRSEEGSQQEITLGEALHDSVQRLQKGLRFRDLQIFEMIFYAQLRNRDIANQLGMDEKQVALLKHRFLKRIQGRVDELQSMQPDSTPSREPEDDLLTKLWERLRPSCPKRSTVGKFVLGTLDDEWSNYIDFHLRQLGCRYCQANLDDVQQPLQDREQQSLCQRIMQSSVGFFRPE